MSVVASEFFFRQEHLSLKTSLVFHVGIFLKERSSYIKVLVFVTDVHMATWAAIVKWESQEVLLLEQVLLSEPFTSFQCNLQKLVRKQRELLKPSGKAPKCSRPFEF